MLRPRPKATLQKPKATWSTGSESGPLVNKMMHDLWQLLVWSADERLFNVMPCAQALEYPPGVNKAGQFKSKVKDEVLDTWTMFRFGMVCTRLQRQIKHKDVIL